MKLRNAIAIILIFGFCLTLFHGHEHDTHSEHTEETCSICTTINHTTAFYKPKSTPQPLFSEESPACLTALIIVPSETTPFQTRGPPPFS